MAVWGTASWGQFFWESADRADSVSVTVDSVTTTDSAPTTAPHKVSDATGKTTATVAFTATVSHLVPGGFQCEPIIPGPGQFPGQLPGAWWLRPGDGTLVPGSAQPGSGLLPGGNGLAPGTGFAFPVAGYAIQLGGGDYFDGSAAGRRGEKVGLLAQGAQGPVPGAIPAGVRTCNAIGYPVSSVSLASGTQQTEAVTAAELEQVTEADAGITTNVYALIEGQGWA